MPSARDTGRSRWQELCYQHVADGWTLEQTLLKQLWVKQLKSRLPITTKTQTSTSVMPSSPRPNHSHTQLLAPEAKELHSYLSLQQQQHQAPWPFLELKGIKDLLSTRRIVRAPPHTHGVILLYVPCSLHQSTFLHSFHAQVQRQGGRVRLRRKYGEVWPGPLRMM